MIDLNDFIPDEDVDALIQRARIDDLGPDRCDVTSTVFIPEDRMCDAAMVSREAGTAGGAVLLDRIAAAYDPKIAVRDIRRDGAAIANHDVIARFHGPLHSVLSMERVALNFVTHLSGVATLTAKFVRQIESTKARIYDTRKTLPGLRGLEKYAVACGGGMTHRLGLYDAVLVKDNHIADVLTTDLADRLTAGIEKARKKHEQLRFVEVECDTLEQLEIVLKKAPIDAVLLDNMGNDQLREALAMRNRLAPKVELEASGGVTLETVRAIAQTGVDRISVGVLTHSAPALDIGLDVT